MTTPQNPFPPVCPDEGRWRAWLDGETEGETSSLESHLASCAPCQATVDQLRQDAALAARIFSTPIPSLSTAEVQRAREQLAWRRAAAAPVRPLAQPRRASSMIAQLSRGTSFARVAVSGLAAALTLGFFALTPQGQTAAAAFLAQFRSERIQVVPLDANTLRQTENLFAQLDNLGTVQRPASLGTEKQISQSTSVASLAEASQKAGFAVKEPGSLPPGVSGPPQISYMPSSEGRFRFDAAKARAYFQSIGQPNVSLPAKFDGASLVVNTPAAVLLSYRGTGEGAMLVVGQAGQLTMGVESPRSDVTLDELREFLLGLPGLSPQLAAQLRAIQDWRNTLPLPIPVDQVSWKQERIAGVEGLLLDDRSGLGSGALWQKDGHIYGVGGTFPADQIKRVADSLR